MAPASSGSGARRLARAVVTVAFACGAPVGCGTPPPPAPVEVPRPVLSAPPAGEPTALGDVCTRGAEDLYVLGADGTIHRFEPDGRPESRFEAIAKLDCNDGSGLQTMSLDHEGVAWVLFSSGGLYRVKLPEAVCQTTAYRHPGEGGVLGMSFTSDVPGSARERLYISDRQGLIGVELPSMKAELLGPLPIGELAGGPDGLLFHVDMADGMLSEIDRRTLARRPVHAFGSAPTGAFTFLRHRRAFVYFVEGGEGASRILRWSPNAPETIDLGLSPPGLRALGRAQSVCVEWSERP